MEHGWPGNVRELSNAVERLVLLAENGRVSLDDLPAEIRSAKRGQGQPVPAAG